MSKVDKKELCLIVGKVSMAINIFVYLCSVWIKWDFYIPLKWIWDIPIMESNQRCEILFVFLGYYAILFSIVFAHIETRDRI